MFQPESITYSDNLEYPKIPLRSFFQFIFTTNKDQDLDHLRGALKAWLIKNGHWEIQQLLAEVLIPKNFRIAANETATIKR